MTTEDSPRQRRGADRTEAAAAPGSGPFSLQQKLFTKVDMPEAAIQGGRTSRSWYQASIADFVNSGPDSVVGRLATNSDFAVLPTQRDAWLAEIDLLQTHVRGLSGSLYIEFSIPRMGRRIDAVLLIGGVVFVIEFKVGATEFDRAARDQVWDYALDLKNFHEASHSAVVVPLLVVTGATESRPVSLCPDPDAVYKPILIRPDDLRSTIDLVLKNVSGKTLDQESWGTAPYLPTPTIIEAARALYAKHSVEAIARHDAGAQNLGVTSRRLEEIVARTKTSNAKAICFLTGVPGAGKTLVGLNIATQNRDRAESTYAVFLSGNGPLVAVLREALTRDEVARQRERGVQVRKGKAGESVKAFIQNVHHFRDDLLADVGPPVEHVAIFDEAQRAWNLTQTANFMRRKKNHPGFTQSEPEFLISCMDRHPDWAVVICLVGGGQEINTGEAGIDAWIDAVLQRFPHWHMYISSRLTDSEYGAKTLERVQNRANTLFDDSLHLAVSMRSFRAESVSQFVKALLDCDKAVARSQFAEIAQRFPIAVCRDLQAAKAWVRNHARGTERYGLVASSKAQRLKPDAIDVRVDVDPVQWFLNDKDDTRSSYYLEDAATEFHVQGLELDWACVAWDGDLRFGDTGWSYHSFRGSRWCRVENDENRRYLRNAYRVLLTRARQGMVIYVPCGDSSDATRSPEFYDSTFRYLVDVGAVQL